MDTKWNYGMVEQWNNGNRKRMTVLFYELIRAIFIKDRSHSPLNPDLRRRIFDIPTFQNSIIPLLLAAGSTTQSNVFDPAQRIRFSATK